MKLENFGFGKRNDNKKFEQQIQLEDENLYRALLSKLNSVNNAFALDLAIREIGRMLERSELSTEESADIKEKINEIQLELISEHLALHANGVNYEKYQYVYDLQHFYKLVEVNPYMAETDKNQYESLLQSTMEPKVIEVMKQQVDVASSDYDLDRIIKINIKDFPFKDEKSREEVMTFSDQKAKKIMLSQIKNLSGYDFQLDSFKNRIAEFPFQDEAVRLELLENLETVKFEGLKSRIAGTNLFYHLDSRLRVEIKSFGFTDISKEAGLMLAIDRRAEELFSEYIQSSTETYRLDDNVAKWVRDFPFAEESTKDKLLEAVDDKAVELMATVINQHVSVYGLSRHADVWIAGFKFSDEGKRLALKAAVDERAIAIFNELIEATSQKYLMEQVTKQLQRFDFADDSVRQQILERINKRLSEIS